MWFPLRLKFERGVLILARVGMWSGLLLLSFVIQMTRETTWHENLSAVQAFPAFDIYCSTFTLQEGSFYSVSDIRSYNFHQAREFSYKWCRLLKKLNFALLVISSNNPPIKSKIGAFCMVPFFKWSQLLLIDSFMAIVYSLQKNLSSPFFKLFDISV